MVLEFEHSRRINKVNKMKQKEAFDFFNELDGFLSIELTESPVRIGSLLNERALPESKITKITLDLQVVDDDYRPLTKEELDSVALKGSTIIIISEGISVEHKAKNGKSFTIRDLKNAVLKTEKKARPKTEWFGGIDVHHVYFEGLHKVSKDTYQVSWGS